MDASGFPGFPGGVPRVDASGFSRYDRKGFRRFPLRTPQDLIGKTASDSTGILHLVCVVQWLLIDQGEHPTLRPCALGPLKEAFLSLRQAAESSE